MSFTANRIPTFRRLTLTALQPSAGAATSAARFLSSTAAVRRENAFGPTAVAYSAVKPGSESEATTPGSGSTEDIANSQGAYDGTSPNPHTSTSQIESEANDSTTTNMNFDQSSANSQPSNLATKSQHQSDRRPSKQQQSSPDKIDHGATRAVKQQQQQQQQHRES